MFLKENTLMKDREALEVNLFEEYLIFSQLVGVSDEISTEFGNLYADLEENGYVQY